MKRKTFKTLCFIAALLIILYNSSRKLPGSIKESMGTNCNTSSSSNCDTTNYHNALDELGEQVNKLYNQCEEQEQKLENSIKILHNKTKLNLKQAKSAANASKNVQKKKASPDHIKKLNKGKTIDTKDAKAKEKKAK
tara:strand:- start:4 stop:414 length:411 start_codon:yes stop_codon:yes gene_type:complete